MGPLQHAVFLGKAYCFSVIKYTKDAQTTRRTDRIAWDQLTMQLSSSLGTENEKFIF